MLVQFKSETGAVDYLESVAVTLLKGMGNSGKVPGAMQADQVSEALATLKTITSRDAGSETQEDGEDFVSLHNRALPLIGLMQRAVENGEYVMWDYDS